MTEITLFETNELFFFYIFDKVVNICMTILLTNDSEVNSFAYKATNGYL